MVHPENLEDRLKSKLESGEISQEEYNELYEKFRKLGILEKDQPDVSDTHNVYATGTKTIDGGKYGSVVSSGKLIVDGPLECRRLSISGAAEIDGNLSVIETSIISGDLEIKGVSKFGGSVSSTGLINAAGDVYTASKFNTSGTLTVEGSIITDKRLVIEGTLNCDRILSSSHVSLSGNIQIGDIVAESLEIIRGNVIIDGSIKAKKVKIMEPFFNLDLNAEELMRDLGDVPPVVKNLSNAITSKFLPKVEQFVNTVTDIFEPMKGTVELEGSISADEIVIANVSISGDVIGDTITLGSNVKVDGLVKYKTSINVLEYEGIEIQRVREEY